jgi:predicted ribosome quality control (RQC) complex YloA/Tae2 family protein
MVQELLSPNGHQVFYGENAKDNEQLTFRHAHKNDIWFHTRDVPGSHVILRPAGNIKPKYVKREDLQFAANIAAQHSKARNKGSVVPVSYCPIQNVSRPKDPSPLGTVDIEGSKTLLGETFQS